IETVDPVSGPWGSTGPIALTRICNEHRLGPYKRQTSDFYPLHWRETPKLLFPEFTDEVLERTAESPFIHLYGSVIRELTFDVARSRPIPGSYLDLLYANHLAPDVLDRLSPVDEVGLRDTVKRYV